MTGRREAAEDLTQEIFMRAYQKLGQFSRRSSFATWFYRLATNCALSFRRKKQSEPITDELDVVSLPAAEEHFDDQIHRQQIQDQIHRALLSLKPKMRIVVILKDVEGLSHQQVAERLGWPMGTVASRLARARKLLAQKLAHLKGIVSLCL